MRYNAIAMTPLTGHFFQLSLTGNASKLRGKNFASPTCRFGRKEICLILIVFASYSYRFNIVMVIASYCYLSEKMTEVTFLCKVTDL